MNGAHCRGAWHKGCTDIIYMAIKFLQISLLSQFRSIYGYLKLVLELPASSLRVLPLSLDAPIFVPFLIYGVQKYEKIQNYTGH